MTRPLGLTTEVFREFFFEWDVDALRELRPVYS